MTRFTVLVCASVSACALSARAQVVPIAVTEAEAIARAVASSHRLEELAARRDGADAVVAQREAARKPTVSAEAGYSRTNHVDEFGIALPNGQTRIIYPDVPDNARTRLSFGVPLYTGHRLELATSIALGEATALRSDLESTKTDVTLEATRAFWTLVVADRTRAVVDEALARTSAHVRNVRAALDAGLVPPNEVLTAVAQESRQRMLSVQARSSRTVAEADLVRVMGLPPGTPVTPEADLSPRPPEASAESLVARALSARPDRRALTERLASTRLRVTSALAARAPVVSLGGGLDYSRPNPRIFPRAAAWHSSWDVGVNVNWPLFDGGRAEADAAEASAAARVIEARIAELDAGVATEVRQRLAEIDASAAAIAASEDGERAAREALRVITERYDAGVAISTDVLDAQGLLLQSSLDRTQAVAAQRLAGARLRRVLGE